MPFVPSSLRNYSGLLGAKSTGRGALRHWHSDPSRRRKMLPERLNRLFFPFNSNQCILSGEAAVVSANWQPLPQAPIRADKQLYVHRFRLFSSSLKPLSENPDTERSLCLKRQAAATLPWGEKRFFISKSITYTHFFSVPWSTGHFIVLSHCCSRFSRVSLFHFAPFLLYFLSVNYGRLSRIKLLQRSSIPSLATAMPMPSCRLPRRLTCQVAQPAPLCHHHSVSQGAQQHCTHYTLVTSDSKLAAEEDFTSLPLHFALLLLLEKQLKKKKSICFSIQL